MNRYMVLNETYKAFAFSAAKRVVAHNTHYAVSLDHADNGQASDSFCGKLRCNSKGTEFAIYDDSNDPYGLKTGKPRRELGIISYKKKLLGPTELIMVMLRSRTRPGAHPQARDDDHPHPRSHVHGMPMSMPSSFANAVHVALSDQSSSSR